jgi:hypothetical protein
MLRLAEIGLFLSPFLIFLLWRFLGPRVRPAMLWGAMAAVLCLAATAVTYGLKQRMDPTERYIPAHLDGGQIIEGHGAER